MPICYKGFRGLLTYSPAGSFQRWIQTQLSKPLRHMASNIAHHAKKRLQQKMKLC
jgi:hypothetical protein